MVLVSQHSADDSPYELSTAKYDENVGRHDVYITDAVGGRKTALYDSEQKAKVEGHDGTFEDVVEK
jgi:hypothetical protein